MIYNLEDIKSRSASAENKLALKGAGGQANNGRKGSPCIEPLQMGETYTLLETEGPGIIRRIFCSIPPGNIYHMRNVIIRIYWDNQEVPSVEVPIGDFFGIAHGKQREFISDLVSMPDGKGFNCWIPMPFMKSARITVENDSDTDVAMFFYQVDFTLGDEISNNIGYFHAQFRRSNPCPIHEDYTILDGVKGKGVYLGTVLGIRSLYPEAWWGEGEFKFFIDGDDKFPTICGTGTEEYIGGGWGLAKEYHSIYHGAPLVEDDNSLYSIYRFHVKDPIYFHEDLRFTIQQIGFGLTKSAKEHFGKEFVGYRAAGITNNETSYFDLSNDYCSTAYWYQSLPTMPFPKLPNKYQRSQNLMQDNLDQKVERTDL